MLPASSCQEISVVMCTYNGVAFLDEQIKSILAQTLQPSEVIIQDDGSTDGTWEALQTYASGNPLIHVFRNEGQHGINHNFFSAMRRARFPLIALSDQDDIWEPRKLELQASAIGDSWLCSGRSVPFSDGGYPVSSDLRKPNYHILRIAYIGALPGHTFLMKRRLLDYLPEQNSCPFLYDWQIQMIAAAAEKIAYVDATLVNFRRHSGAATANKPVNNHLASKTTWDYIAVSLLHHARLQREVRRRFSYIEPMLAALPFRTRSIELCRRMAQLQMQRGAVNFVRRTGFFVRHCEHLFYTHERRRLSVYLRALFFPFSCGYYYRNILTERK